MNKLFRIEPDRLVLFVRLTPKGGRDAIDGVETGADGKTYLKVRVTAPPEDGKANAALVAVVAGCFDVAKSSVSIISGQTSRLKQVAVTGYGERLAAAAAMAKINGAQV
jgi:uncharacterized protein